MKLPLTLINTHKNISEAYTATDTYIKDNAEIADTLSQYLWALQESVYLVPQTQQNYLSGHFFPFSESYHELENSLELARQGFYRYSLYALRCVLELGMLGLFYDKDDQSYKDIQEWIQSIDPTPYFRKSLRQLFELLNFQVLNSKYNLQQEAEDLYSSLSDFVHVRGYNYSSTGQSHADINKFNEGAFIKYVDSMRSVVRCIVTMTLLKYPLGMQVIPIDEKFGLEAPTGGLISEFSREMILTILDSN